ncbi:sigma-70 family RNA polymerase sigma factor [Alicyclobacillus fodiniaquatilis]|uniref:Sigma-70 family RNA polymerase sigma factor n=1 Tax=Alicyclobacillus fodiniaquatilis TaxID=1661150 RepID=A0ABW4JIF8_9BACL
MRMVKKDTSQWMTAVCADKVDTASVLAQYEGLLRSVAARYKAACGYEEAYQEACSALLTAIQLYNPARGPFPAYAAAKVRGDVRTAMRRVWRYTARQTFIGASTEDDKSPSERLEDLWASQTNCPDTAWEMAWVHRQELQRIVQKAHLSARERLWLQAYLREVTMEALAARVGVSLETVKTWRKRALAKMRQTAAALGYTWRDFA